ncbi:MAG: translation elongation factor Ts [Actinomycetota bacterium]|nr:translation elongation factor Ts [Actinomycetota bacterium]
MPITAADVKRLRDLTSAGMMDSKKALEEADGDFDRAGEILRVKGAAKAAKRGAERTASAGLVANSGPAMVELNCETDFVAKSADFTAAAQQIADVAAAAHPADAEELKAAPAAAPGGSTVAELVEALAVKLGEKIELGRVAVFAEPVVAYLHRRASDLPPAVGVLVEYAGNDVDAARAAAMQVAAMRPTYLSREEVPAGIVAKERELAEATAREEGKPEQALPKIVEGRLNGFFKEVALLDQPSVTESKKSVRAQLDDAGVSVKRFARFEVGA